MSKLIRSDCLKAMRKMPDNSIDLMVTDPPYGLKFMGKDWDKAVPKTEIWRECLRVLKPGAFAFIMCAPRQDCLGIMISRLIETGFRTDFTSIYWAYASGFPKASNISKMVDKRLGAEREKVKFSISPRSTAGKGTSNELDERPWLTEARKVGYNESCGDIPATPQAKVLDGSFGGFQPKPALEVILVCMKPLSEKTFVDQALKNGKGITWLGDGRIPYFDGSKREHKNSYQPSSAIQMYAQGEYRKPNWYEHNQGRFPANLLISDDCLNDGRVDKGTKPHPVKSSKEKYPGWGSITKKSGEIVNYGDSGSFSRYFSLDSWWDEKIKSLPESVQKTFPFLIVPKASKKEKNMGCEGLKVQTNQDYDGRTGQNNSPNRPDGSKRKAISHKNNHPTVKPIKLMSYLITLGSREEDIVLDPFAGTCTTAIAAKLLKRKWIMVEINPEYLEIGKRRILAF